jgi:hypothetical protein
VQGFAINRRYINDVLYPTYPKIMFKLQTDTMKLYKKRIFKPLIEQRNMEISEINKKATYKNIKVEEMASNLEVCH